MRRTCLQRTPITLPGGPWTCPKDARNCQNPRQGRRKPTSGLEPLTCSLRVSIGTLAFVHRCSELRINKQFAIALVVHVRSCSRGLSSNCRQLSLACSLAILLLPTHPNRPTSHHAAARMASEGLRGLPCAGLVARRHVATVEDKAGFT